MCSEYRQEKCKWDGRPPPLQLSSFIYIYIYTYIYIYVYIYIRIINTQKHSLDSGLVQRDWPNGKLPLSSHRLAAPSWANHELVGVGDLFVRGKRTDFQDLECDISQCPWWPIHPLNIIESWNAYQVVTRKTRTKPHCKVYETVPITGWSNILCRRTLFCRRSRPSSKAIPRFRDLGPHLFGVPYALAFCDSCSFGKLNIQRRNESVHPFSSLRFTTKIDLKSDHWLQNLS